MIQMITFEPRLWLVAFGGLVGAIFGAALIGLAVTVGVIIALDTLTRAS